MKISEKILKLRKERGLSQEEFGNEINVSRQAVSKWESDQTKPDTNKIVEIAKFFNVSYDYLLNDDVLEYNNNEHNASKTRPTIKLKSLLIKIILILLLIYFIIFLYKVCVFSRFYFGANSFSEENYSIFQSTDFSDSVGNSKHFSQNETKYGKKFITYSYWYEGMEPNLSEDNCEIANQVDYVDADKKLDYSIYYNLETGKYIYNNSNSRFLEENQQGYTESELKELLNFDKNLVRETTLSKIPSNIKDILLSSLNPLCKISLINKSIIISNISGTFKEKITLNNDYILESYQFTSDFEGKSSTYYSYDYVPDHQKDFKEPTESFKDKIENILDI